MIYFSLSKSVLGGWALTCTSGNLTYCRRRKIILPIFYTIFFNSEVFSISKNFWSGNVCLKIFYNLAVGGRRRGDVVDFSYSPNSRYPTYEVRIRFSGNFQAFHVKNLAIVLLGKNFRYKYRLLSIYYIDDYRYRYIVKYRYIDMPNTRMTVRLIKTETFLIFLLRICKIRIYISL